MNVTGVSATSDLSQRYADLTALQSALQSGSIANAQHAFAAFQQQVQKVSQTAGPNSIFAPGSQPSRDLQRLNSALNSADLAGANLAFASLKQDIQAVSHPVQPAQSLGPGSRIVNGAHSFSSNSNIPTAAALGSIMNLKA